MKGQANDLFNLTVVDETAAEPLREPVCMWN